MKRRWILPALLILTAHATHAQDRVFDVHVHLREGQASLDAYEAQATADGRAVTGLGAMWFGGPYQALQGDTGDTRSRNDGLIALAADHPKMVPIATIHPYDGEAALDELTRIAGRGVKVLKLHAHTQKFDNADPRVLDVVKHAGTLGVIVLMDNANILPGDSEKMFNLAIAAPETKFIFAHMGGLNFRFWNILALARTADGVFAENVHFDISGPLHLAPGSPIEAEFVWTLRNVGIDRILLGSDYPQLTLDQTLDALEKLPLDEGEKAKIRYGNAQALFGL